MPDMLVKLYELRESKPEMEKLKKEEIEIRRVLPPERHLVVEWIGRTFNPFWGSEAAVAITRLPVTCFVAVHKGKPVGFACYDATSKGSFGPTGVHPEYRGKGIGKALLLVCLQAMYDDGYAYAIIGGAGPADFYAKVAGAAEIPGSVPGIYRGMLRADS
jgi:GNAT superfamily N-acetyltransferase